MSKTGKGRGDESFVYAGKVSVGGNAAYLAAVVLKDSDSRFYLHEVVDEKGNVIYARKDANTGVQDRGNRKYGDAGASVASSVDVSSANNGLSGTSNIIVAQTEPTVKPSGLPMMRQESLQDDLEASVTGGRTLGDNERRIGAPIPSTVESQLQALEALTAEEEDASSVAKTILKYVGEDASNYWLEHRNDGADDARRAERQTHVGAQWRSL